MMSVLESVVLIMQLIVGMTLMAISSYVFSWFWEGVILNIMVLLYIANVWLYRSGDFSKVNPQILSVSNRFTSASRTVCLLTFFTLIADLIIYNFFTDENDIERRAALLSWLPFASSIFVATLLLSIRIAGKLLRIPFLYFLSGVWLAASCLFDMSSWPTWFNVMRIGLSLLLSAIVFYYACQTKRLLLL